MKYGVRDICDVVFKATKSGSIGKYHYSVGQPVLYIDSAKTSAIEGAATTVYATGGRGNSRLIAWEGEKTLTFTVEDALLSDKSFAMLSGAGLMNLRADNGDTAIVHQTSMITLRSKVKKEMISLVKEGKDSWSATENGEGEAADVTSNLVDYLELEETLGIYSEDTTFILYYEGWVRTEGANHGYIGPNKTEKLPENEDIEITKADLIGLTIYGDRNAVSGIENLRVEVAGEKVKGLSCSTTVSLKDPILTGSSNHPMFVMSMKHDSLGQRFIPSDVQMDATSGKITCFLTPTNLSAFESKLNVNEFDLPVMVDFYTTAKPAVNELTIDAENFADNYYVEAKTTFKRQYDGKELDAMITFPNVKVQSNFTFNMAATGDPSTFTFTMDAMPGYTVQNPNKKVLCLMQIVDNVITDNANIKAEDSIIGFADEWVPIVTAPQNLLSNSLRLRTKQVEPDGGMKDFGTLKYIDDKTGSTYQIGLYLCIKEGETSDIYEIFERFSTTSTLLVTGTVTKTPLEIVFTVEKYFDHNGKTLTCTGEFVELGTDFDFTLENQKFI